MIDALVHPRMPMVGDRVWFYFIHAFTDARVVGSHYFGDLWRSTGKFELRCRPARVAKHLLDMQTPITPIGWWSDLDVEFSDDDRELIHRWGSVARRLCRQQPSVTPHVDIVGADAGYFIEGRFPGPGHWAWDPMPGFDGGFR